MTAESIYDNYEFITRKEWGAVKPKIVAEDLVHPLGRVIIYHTVSQSCYQKFKCIEYVRNIQNYHISIDFGDIGYNFLVGGDGRAYEGQGWDKVGAHTIGIMIINI